MAEQAQSRIQESMTSLVNDLDKSFLRIIQRDMHRCAAECCDQKEPSVDQVHSCIERCSAPLHGAQSYVQNELQQFQERLQRCVLMCQDRVKDRVTANTSEAQVNVYKAEFEACAMSCVDDHIQLMPSTKRRIADTLAKNT
uniref:Protein FAM136A-like isoform X2 n=1 Tax=Hirondellea gigas TaxID=1518452 RepID=A0A6A7G566_9CRUS